MLDVREIKDVKIWEDFLTKKEIEYYPFFQSWSWGEVQQKLGRNIIRLGLFDGEKLVGVVLVIEVTARRGHYLHLRHGPVLLEFNQKYFNEFFKQIKKRALEMKVSFIRISPLIVKEYDDKGLFEKGFLNAPIHNMDAETCLVLNVTKPEGQLLGEMRKTHRYLVRKGIASNIKIIRSKKISDINTFLDLYSDLSHRRGFVPHKDIKEEFEVLSKNDQAILLLAEYEGKVIAGAFIDFVGDMAIYRHGASLDRYKNIPASYLLQWKAILEAKKRGKKLYNFWGVVPLDKPNHPWKGITLFKTGFGGERLEFIHAKDFPLNYYYWKNYLIEFYTKWRKGY
ncbi:peptidoglycan bridge formation glycyltransferase FemA/FemB family protein [Candidatus Microgenomates bacterium]|nr:MAG: peptidoglycan bridge formation glycyltransferase FemA/FemB family protein [Candidatus Microgenomates bacterium]